MYLISHFTSINPAEKKKPWGGFVGSICSISPAKVKCFFTHSVIVLRVELFLSFFLADLWLTAACGFCHLSLRWASGGWDLLKQPVQSDRQTVWTALWGPRVHTWPQIWDALTGFLWKRNGLLSPEPLGSQIIAAWQEKGIKKMKSVDWLMPTDNAEDLMLCNLYIIKLDKHS